MRLIISVLSFCLLVYSTLTVAADPTLRIDLGNDEAVEMVMVKSGSFFQGSPNSELGREDDELQHKVTLTKDFWIAKTPVTVGQFRRFVFETKYETEAETGKSGGFGLVGEKIEQSPELNWRNPGYPVTDQHPVSIITLADTIAFNEWLSKKSGQVIQLPSEAQWEFACRGGTETRFYSVDSEADLDTIAWYKKNAKTPMPVAQKNANSLGLFDMCGNVYQWCGDIYGPYAPDESTDPQIRKAIDNQPQRVVLRGGSFSRDATRCRSAERYRADKGTRNIEIGFRVISMENMPTGEITDLIEDSPQARLLATSDDSIRTSNNENTINFPEANSQSSAPTATKMNFQIASWLLYAAFFLLFAGVVIVALIISSMPKWSRVGLPRSGEDLAFLKNIVPIRTADDGFWLSTTSYITGSIVYYHYYHLGNRHDDSVVIHNSDQQFVYTGQTPANVAIDRVEEPDDKDDPYFNEQQNDNWNLQQRHSEQLANSGSQSNQSDDAQSWTSNDGSTSPDRELLSDGNSSSFPPAY
jgi:sulfatase modifying factor 1